MWTHLELAKEWEKRGNSRMVIAIVKSYYRLHKMQMALTDSRSVTA